MIFLIECFSPLSIRCVSSLAVQKIDCGDFDSPLPALSAHHDKCFILESIMDADVEALFSLDIELSSSLVQAFSHHAEHCLFGMICFFVLLFFVFCMQGKPIYWGFPSIWSFRCLVIEGNAHLDVTTFPRLIYRTVIIQILQLI